MQTAARGGRLHYIASGETLPVATPGTSRGPCGTLTGRATLLTTTLTLGAALSLLRTETVPVAALLLEHTDRRLPGRQV